MYTFHIFYRHVYACTYIYYIGNITGYILKYTTDTTQLYRFEAAYMAHYEHLSWRIYDTSLHQE